MNVNSLIAVPYSGKKDKLTFSYFPAYASFLLANKLEEYTRETLARVNDLDLPLMKLLRSLPKDEMFNLSRESIRKFFIHVAENRINELIETSIQAWINNNSQLIDREQIVVEDITKGNYLRKTTLLKFIPDYTSDINTALKIIEEIDVFITETETLSIKLITTLQQSLYKQAQAFAHIGNWKWDIATKKLLWSDEVFAIHELEVQPEFYSTSVTPLNHPDDLELITTQIKNSIETGNPYNFFYRIILNNGKEKTLHALGEVIMDKNNKPVQMIGTLQDVTKQKLTEKELQEKQNFIQTIADTTPSLIVAYNVQTGKFIFINKGLNKLLGYDMEEIFEKDVNFFQTLIHPDDLKILYEKNLKALERANKFPELNKNLIEEFQYRVRNKSGEYRWFHTYGTIFSRDVNKQVSEVLNVSIDITDLKNTSDNFIKLNASLEITNEALRKNEERYHRMVDEVKDYAIIVLSKEGIIENWNQGAERIKGYKSEEIVGKNFRIFYPETDQKNHLPEYLINQAVQAGKATHEGWRIRKDGTRFWGNIVITALHDNEGDIIGFTKVTRDLTEIKLAEDQLKLHAEELEWKNKELEQTNKELESFTYIASHDLQEPLRKIQFITKQILEKEYNNLSIKGKDYFKRLDLSAERMQKLIDDVLAFSRTTSISDAFIGTNLGKLLKEVKSVLKVSIDESHAIIKSSGMTTVRVIPSQFSQLLQNLLSNAIKYRNKNIKLHIAIEGSFIKSSFLPKGIEAIADSYFKLSIKDNGIGFEQKYADKIFELFQRLHGKEDYEGTGIGLAICKKIVLNHNGFITAEGSPGVGAIFNVFIPYLS